VNRVEPRGPKRGASGFSMIPPAGSAGQAMALLNTIPASHRHREKSPPAREIVGQWLFAAADMKGNP